jgi:signal transduction histidine kinase
MRGTGVTGAFRARPSRAVVRSLFWTTVVLNLLFVLALLALRSPGPIVNVWLEAATQWVPVALFWVVAWRQGFVRRDILLIAVAVTVSAAGDTYYSLAMDSNGNLQFPSPADIGYLLFYPLMLIGLVVLVRRQRQRGGLAVLLDSVVAALGAGAVLAALLGPALADAAAGPTFIASALALAYPIFDIVLIAVVAGIAAGGHAGPRWGLLLGGLVFLAAGDIVYAILESESVYVAGTPLDATWAIGLGLMAWWVERQDSPVVREYKERPAARVLVPLIAVAACLAVLLYASQRALPVYVLILAALTVFLAAVPIVLRQRMLADVIASQEQVVTQLIELDTAKTELMSTLNHEIRTPLASIHGYLELINDGVGGEIPDAAAELLQVVSRNADRLTTLADDMLVLARLEANASPSQSQPVDIGDLLRTVAASLGGFAEGRGVELIVEACPTPAIVRGDTDQLRRTFTNIAENAIKFTPGPGTVRFITDLESSAKGSGTVSVRIVDDGMGIPEDELPHLFTKFYRASNARAGAVQGSGLGLSIAQNLIQAHEGKVAVTSSIGVGTTVEVLLPTG